MNLSHYIEIRGKCTLRVTYIGQLCPFHARPGLEFVVAFVTPESVHLQLIEVGHLRQIDVRVVAVVLGLFAPSLRPGRLDTVLVIVADVDVLRGRIAAQLQPFVLDRLLDAFAVARVSCRITATLILVDQATGLVVVATT